MRARLALAAADVDCELREVVLRDKPAELLAASPKGTVPVLVTPEGTVIDQSLDIMRWALRRHDPLAWLGDSDETHGEMLALIADCDGDFKQQLDRYKYPNRQPHPDHGRAARTQAATFIAGLDVRLAATGHLVGPRSMLADAALLPFVRQFAMVEPAWFSSQPWPHLKGWLADWTGSPLFERVMRKHATWSPGVSARPSA